MYLKKELYELIRTDESIFDFIQESALDGLWYWDLEKIENEWMNAKFWAVLGYNPDEMPHKSSAWQHIINQDDLKVANENFAKHCENPDHPYDQIVRYTHKNGSTVWLRCRGMAIRDKNGKPIRMLGAHHDITELKKAEEKRAQSERTYREIFNGIDDSLFIHEIGSGVILDVNDSMLKNFGYDRDDIPNLTVSDLSSQEAAYKNEYSRELLNRASKGETIVFEWLCKRRNGDLFYSEIILKRVSIGGIERVMAIVRDITERKQAEEEARKREKILNKVFDILPIGLWFADKDGKLLKGNPAGVKIWGAEPKVPLEEYGVFKAWRLPSGEEIQPNDWALARTIREKVTIADELIEIDAFDGNKKIILNYTAPILDENDQILGAIVVNNDITEQKKAEIELIHSKEKAEESDRLKSAFLANMSHEIRTPMNGILGFADLLQKRELNRDEQQKYISIINKSGTRLLNIINDILDISKIEAGLVELHLNEVNINDIIGDVVAFFKPEATNKNIKLSHSPHLPAGETSIKTDREKIYAVLTNLVKNAIKYTEKGEIELGCVRKESQLEFYVKDTGIGIPKERQQAVFKRFVQADIEDKMARQGAGLGLAISKSYVELLGGKIWVESREGYGSSFYFTLPYNVSKMKTTDPFLAPSVRNDTIRKLKTLIVEDDIVSEMLFDETAKIFSKEILKAKSGAEAIEICRDNPDIDLILMDIRLPLINGYEATRQIRKFNQEVIIIAQTAYGQIEDRDESIKAGCDDYITKPIEENKLLKLIQKYFSK